jgi:hypothetical protein
MLLSSFFVEHPTPIYASVNFYDQKKKKTADSICVCNGSYHQQQRSKYYFHLQEYPEAGFGKNIRTGAIKR